MEDELSEIPIEVVLDICIVALARETLELIMGQSYSVQAKILVADTSHAILGIIELDSILKLGNTDAQLIDDLLDLLLENRCAELESALWGYLLCLKFLGQRSSFNFWASIWNSLNLEERRLLRANALDVSLSVPEP
jgi:hypothetical protein